MANLLQAQPATATVPIRAARVFVEDLLAKGCELNVEVADALQAQININELMGLQRVDVDPILMEALRTKEEVEVEESIDSLVDLVIDLRQ